MYVLCTNISPPPLQTAILGTLPEFYHPKQNTNYFNSHHSNCHTNATQISQLFAIYTSVVTLSTTFLKTQQSVFFPTVYFCTIFKTNSDYLSRQHSEPVWQWDAVCPLRGRKWTLTIHGILFVLVSATFQLIIPIK